MAEQIVYDLNSFKVVTDALMDLIRSYPALQGMDVAFSMLDTESGVAMFPTSGAVVQSETKDITDHVEQICIYPFSVIYRAAGLSERRKAAVKEWLDNLGKWLEKQPITVNNTTYKLDEYPDLTGDRKFLNIERTSPAYQFQVSDDNVEDWLISIQALYKNEFDIL